MSKSKVVKQLNPEWVRQGATVRAIRELRGLTIDGLANLLTARGLKVSRPYLSNIEAGRKRLTPQLVKHIADILVVPQISLVRPDEIDQAAA